MKMVAIFVLVSVVLAEKAAGNNVAKRAIYCPSGWTYYNYRCFKYVSSSYTWSQAENYCVTWGGNLASVHSSTEYNWLKSFIYSKTNQYPQTWIGGSDQEGNWFWSDGSHFSFKSWCSGRPTNNAGVKCIIMNYSGNNCWLDYKCTYPTSFVCEEMKNIKTSQTKN